MIPLDRLERNPLITQAGYALLTRILQSASAPRWNFATGDRVVAEDLPLVESYRRDVRAKRLPGGRHPPAEILARIEALRDRVLLFREHLPLGFDLERDWAHVPTCDREDLALRVERLVPWGEDLSRLIVYDTSGTSGHVLRVPHHPLAMAQSHALMEYALERHGVRLEFAEGRVACFNVGAQEARTVVFANVFSVWNQAGFAKLNLSPSEWKGQSAARDFFLEFQPLFLTGDPVGFAEMARWELPANTAALVSTAVALGPGLKRALSERYGCPVIDWYSATETGPVAYACPEGEGFHVLPHDLFVEVLDEEGFPVAPGGRGEIAVTGGHNPYLPLLRYRTGDWGRLDLTPCPCGETTPRLLDLEGREPVFFRSASGAVVNAVDLGRILRDFPVVQHEVIQRADGACEVTVRAVAGLHLDLEAMAEALRRLLGEGTKLSLREDGSLGQRPSCGKVRPYRSEVDPEGAWGQSKGRGS